MRNVKLLSCKNRPLALLLHHFAKIFMKWSKMNGLEKMYVVNTSVEGLMQIYSHAA